MRGQFRDYSGGIYTNPRVRVVIDDGRSFVRRTPDRYDVIQASLVDTWAATAAGAYTLTENTLYTVEAFNDYLDHLTDDGVLTITRWVLDGLRLVSLAQAAVRSRAAGTPPIAPRDRPARSGRDVSAEEDAVHRATRSRGCATDRRPTSASASCTRPASTAAPPYRGAGERSTTPTPADYARLITTPDRAAVLRRRIRGPQPDDRRPAVLSFTRRRSSINFRPRSAGRCCSATASAR